MRFSHPRLRDYLLAIALIALIALPTAQALTWDPTGPHKVPLVPFLTSDSKIRFVDAGPSVGTPLKSDAHIKFFDADNNNVWDVGEAVIYDAESNNVYDGVDLVIAGSTPTVGASLRSDAHLKFVDVNSNGFWDMGEPVVYDSNNNGVYDSGETVIGGRPPVLGTALANDSTGKVRFVDTDNNNVRDPGEPVVYDSNNDGVYSNSTDPRIKFVDSDSNNHWDQGEPVVYDMNNDNLFETGEPVITGTAPPSETQLNADSHFRIVDADRNGIWEPGEAVVYDSSPANGIIDPGDPIVATASPAPQTALTTDIAGKIKFFDAKGTGVFNQTADPVVYDSNNDGSYSNSSDPKIKFFSAKGTGVYNPTTDTVVYDANNDNIYDQGDSLIAGPTLQFIDSDPLTRDIHFRLIDTDRNGHWEAGETVVYDSDNNNVYDAGEPVISGISPAPGTLLLEPVISGTSPPVGSPLKTDSRLKFVDVNKAGSWAPGEAVTYDTDLNGFYELGEPLIAGATPSVGTVLSEPVIVGPRPTIGAALKSDPKVTFIDANSNNVLDSGETVVYDADNNKVFDLNDTVLASGAQGDGRWDPGEVVVHDVNNDNVFDTGDVLIAGTAPLNGTPLRSDPELKFIDANQDSTWEPGEVVVYDTDNNGYYEPGEPVVAGNAPPNKFAFWPSIASDSLGRAWLTWNEKTPGSSQAPDVFVKLWNGASWGDKVQVTTDPHNDTTSSLVPLSNQTMMVVWASDKTGHNQLYYRLYSTSSSLPVASTGIFQLTNNSTVYDDEPTGVQDHAGRIWVFWTRHNAKSTISDIYYKYFNGTGWSNDFPVSTASLLTLQERSPSATQTKDGRIWVAFASNDTGPSGIYYTTTDGTLAPLPSKPTLLWSSKVNLFPSNNVNDEHPALVQSRDGAIYVFYHESALTGGVSDTIRSGNSYTNGASWNSSIAFTPGPNDGNPSAAQVADKSLWAVWNTQGANTEEVWYTTSSRITGIHDVGVRSLNWVRSLPVPLRSLGITPPASGIIRSGDAANITITVKNYGDFSEDTTFTLKYNSTVLTTFPLTLLPNQTSTIQYTWQTARPFWGKYILSASILENAGLGVEPVVDQGDNTLSGLVRISPPGDVDGNGTVNILDAALLAFAFGSKGPPLQSTPDPLWNPNADIDHNGVVNILDAAVMAFYFGRGA